MDRRRLLTGLGAAGILALLPGCSEDDIKKILDTCPTDPAATGGIDWTPDLGHPLFWGVQDLGTAQGAPRDMLIYYPSLEGSPTNAPIHQRCLTRWPVVLFLHGQPPTGVPTRGLPPQVDADPIGARPLRLRRGCPQSRCQPAR
jgi:hypothetical protein